MKQAYQECIEACPIWKYVYAVPEKSKKNRKNRNGFLYLQNLNQKWRLVLPNTFNVEGKNILKIAIAEAHAATAHCGIEKTMKALCNKFECQFFSRLAREYVGSCNICRWTQYLRKEPIGYVTPLHVLVRPWSDITMNCFKLSLVFINCSRLYSNIPIGKDQIVYISQLYTIVDRQSGF